MSEQSKERDRRYRVRLKRECFAHYGGPMFDDMSEAELETYELHHPDGNGNWDRALRVGLGLESPGGYKFYLKLRQELWPAGYVVITRAAHDILHGRLPKEEHGRLPDEELEREIKRFVLF
jgi:hypothetical protein